MAAVLVEHRVADFAAWLPHYEAHGPERSAAGVTHSIVWQDADDPNHVFVIIKHPDVNVLRAFGQSEDLKQRMQDAGVLSASFTFFGEPHKYEN